MPSYLLDTNFCIALIRKKPENALRRLVEHPVTDVAVSIVTVAELEYGVAKSRQPKLNRAKLDGFLQPLQVLLFDDAAALAYGEARGKLEARGEVIGPLDLLLAAHALSLDLTVVTNNTREFTRVDDLKVEDWTA